MIYEFDLPCNTLTAISIFNCLYSFPRSDQDRLHNVRGDAGLRPLCLHGLRLPSGLRRDAGAGHRAAAPCVLRHRGPHLLRLPCLRHSGAGRDARLLLTHLQKSGDLVSMFQSDKNKEHIFFTTKCI